MEAMEVMEAAEAVEVMEAAEVMERHARLELATSCMASRCASRLRQYRKWTASRQVEESKGIEPLLRFVSTVTRFRDGSLTARPALLGGG